MTYACILLFYIILISKLNFMALDCILFCLLQLLKKLLQKDRWVLMILYICMILQNTLC